MRRNWRNSWIGRFLGIHSPTAHAMGVCWCRGTRRELILTAPVMMADMEAFYRYISRAENPKKKKE